MAAAVDHTPRALRSAPPRTYGNWRRPASPGLGRLGTLGTATLFVGLVVLVVIFVRFGWRPALVLALALGIFLGFLAAHDRHDRSGLTRLATRLGWLRARRTGANLYRSGPLGRTGWGTFQLPGLAANSRLSEWRDSYGRPFALLYVPATAHYTVVLATEPDGASLVDEEQVDAWVAHWGQWLAALGNEPGLVAASVTVETAPDPGTRLRREVTANLDPDAHPIAAAMLAEVTATYPQGSASIRAWVALTFDAKTAVKGAGGTFESRTARKAAKRRPPRDAETMSRELASRLPGLTHSLSATGAGAARPVTAQELCEVVRVAYDPAAAPLLEAARDEALHGGRPLELDWTGVGPAAAEASWDTYRHDSAFSVSWSMTSAPRGEVLSGVLGALLGPHPDIDRKRVTLTYRPLDAAQAAKVVEADKRAADFKAGAVPRPTARVLAEQRSAAAAATEEARGAGLVNFALMVTATVTDPARLGDARAAVDHLAATARIGLRPVFGSQDSAFAATLPLGLVLPAHLNVPQGLRDLL